MAYQNHGSLGYNNYFSTKMMLQRKQPTNLLSSLFMSTVNMASKMLMSVASNNFTMNFSSPSFASTAYTNLNASITTSFKKWKIKDHFRFLSLLFTWFSMWVLRFVTDHFPSLIPSSTPYLLHSPPSDPPQKQHSEGVDIGSSAVGSSSSASLALIPSSSSNSYLAPVQNMELVSHDGFVMDSGDIVQSGQSIEALGRALCHVLERLNELPATSRKYEFAMAMADRILDDNTRDGHLELLNVNRVALSSAFESTTNLLYHTLNTAAMSHADHLANTTGPWTTRMIRKLPLGSYITAYMKGGWSALIPALDSMWQLQKRNHMFSRTAPCGDDGFMGSDQSTDVVGAEKLAQELVWITDKLRACKAVDEALVQWGLASNLASLSLNANPRVQALLFKLSASLVEDIARVEFKVPTQVQYRLLVLWLPLFCYASSGLRYPVLSSYEKLNVETNIGQMVAGLAPMEQEVVLRNWLQDFTICASDWPNLRASYDRWCHFSRQVLAS